MINFCGNDQTLIKWRSLESWWINFPLERQLPHTVLFTPPRNQSKTVSLHRDTFAYSKTDFIRNDEIMIILTDFPLTVNPFKVKKTPSSLNIRLLKLSTQNLSDRSLKDHLNLELHLHFQVTLKNSKMAYFTTFHTKSPWKQNPFCPK